MDSQAAFLPKEDLEALVEVLVAEGYRVIGPRHVEGAIRLRPIQSATQIARGVADEQSGGRYRLSESDPQMIFEYVVGPDSPKRYFFPPQQQLFTLHVAGERFELDDAVRQPPKLAFIGLRGCELAAIAIQDRVFGYDRPDETYRCESETYYRRAREQAFLVAVNCTRPDGTCFCDSMGTGPEVRSGYDLALTELTAGFVVRTGSDAGGAVLRRLPTRSCSATELELESLKLARARDQMGRSLDTERLVELLKGAVEHPRWTETAKRCLSCGNCTMVCPTCFCSTVTDGSELSSRRVTRLRRWESCFTHQFSYTTAGPVRNTIRGRYRHWLRHKLCTWHEQFGTSGCVGCGRCITWCPVGIDLTEEVAAIRDSQPIEPQREPRQERIYKEATA